MPAARTYTSIHSTSKPALLGSGDVKPTSSKRPVAETNSYISRCDCATWLCGSGKAMPRSWRSQLTKSTMMQRVCSVLARSLRDVSSMQIQWMCPCSTSSVKFHSGCRDPSVCSPNMMRISDVGRTSCPPLTAAPAGHSLKPPHTPQRSSVLVLPGMPSQPAHDVLPPQVPHWSTTLYWPLASVPCPSQPTMRPVYSSHCVPGCSALEHRVQCGPDHAPLHEHDV
mmetsp:Transcript_34542/g.106701  ORF Transcript_34542/g.106701 Transcript_34542/m.106701 type:complete len:225 (-) Transcript_34542:4125-4799(-)